MPKDVVPPDRRLRLLNLILEHHIFLVYLLVLILLAHEVQTSRPILHQPRHPLILECVRYLVVKPHVLLSNIFSPIITIKEMGSTVSDGP